MSRAAGRAVLAHLLELCTWYLMAGMLGSAGLHKTAELSTVWSTESSPAAKQQASHEEDRRQAGKCWSSMPRKRAGRRCALRGGSTQPKKVT